MIEKRNFPQSFGSCAVQTLGFTFSVCFRVLFVVVRFSCFCDSLT